MEASQTLKSSDLLLRDASSSDREGDEDAADALVGSGAEPEETRRPLRFDPEPQQRMVVVRRRKKRRSRKLTPGEKFFNGLRVVGLAFVAILLVLKITGQQDMLVRLKDHLFSAVRPMRAHLPHIDTDMIALVLVGLVLVYTMPGVPGKVNRLLGLSDDHRRS